MFLSISKEYEEDKNIPLKFESYLCLLIKSTLSKKTLIFTYPFWNHTDRLTSGIWGLPRTLQKFKVSLTTRTHLPSWGSSGQMAITKWCRYSFLHLTNRLTYLLLLAFLKVRSSVLTLSIFSIQFNNV